MFDATYIKANDPITKRALWIREQRMRGRVWRWMVLTDPAWARPRVIASEATQDEASHRDTTGLLRFARNDIQWNLTWDDPGQRLRLLPSWMYRLPVPTKYESPHWNGRVSGQLVILDPSASPQDDKLVWSLTHWPAQQGHLWGWRTSKAWSWAHGNCFQEDHTAAFEILTSGNRTVLCLQSQQFNYLANGISAWHCTQHEQTDTHWNWTFSHHDMVITGQFRLGYADMAAVVYPTPQNDTRTCHNTKVGAGVITVVRSGKPILQLTAIDTLAWEFVRP